MCTSLLDPERRTWTRFDWEEYNKKDKEFGERFIQTCLTGSYDEIYDLFKEGAGFYHFPNDIDKISTLLVENSPLYFFIMSLKKDFYQYESA